MIEFFSSPAFQQYIVYALAAVGAAGMVATVTPTNIDNKLVGYVIKLLNLVAGNFWKASNAGPLKAQHDTLVDYVKKLEDSLQKKEDTE